MNGATVKLRIIASAVIALTVVMAGSYLLHEGIQLPIVYWLLSFLAIAGVTGADVVASVAAIWGKSKETKP